MTTAQIIVTLLGLAGIAWVNYYFFLARPTPVVAAAQPGAGHQRIRVVVEGGYLPGGGARALRAEPVRLEFDRARDQRLHRGSRRSPTSGSEPTCPPHRTTPGRTSRRRSRTRTSSPAAWG